MRDRLEENLQAGERVLYRTAGIWLPQAWPLLLAGSLLIALCWCLRPLLAGDFARALVGAGILTGLFLAAAWLREIFTSRRCRALVTNRRVFFQFRPIDSAAVTIVPHDQVTRVEVTDLGTAIVDYQPRFSLRIGHPTLAQDFARAVAQAGGRAEPPCVGRLAGAHGYPRLGGWFGLGLGLVFALFGLLQPALGRFDLSEVPTYLAAVLAPVLFLALLAVLMIGVLHVGFIGEHLVRWLAMIVLRPWVTAGQVQVWLARETRTVSTDQFLAFLPGWCRLWGLWLQVALADVTTWLAGRLYGSSLHPDSENAPH